MHVIQGILAKFKSGEREVVGFWLEPGARFIHIRYFGVRRQGRYEGCLEVSQDVTDIRALTGQRRLLEWNRIAKQYNTQDSSIVPDGLRRNPLRGFSARGPA